MKKFVVGIVVTMMLCVGSPVWAQEETEEKGNVFNVATYKIQFQNLDRMFELWEEYWKPVNAKNEYVTSMRVFTHLYGSDWQVLMVTEYESLSAMEAANKRAEEIRKELFPEDDQWQEMLAEVQGLFLGHTDNIVVEVPNLRK